MNKKREWRMAVVRVETPFSQKKFEKWLKELVFHVAKESEVIPVDKFLRDAQPRG